MPRFEVRFSAYCSVCGDGICNNITVDDRYDFKIEIEPCEKCLENVRSEAYEGGFNDGFEKGYDIGHKEQVDQKGLFNHKI